MTDWKEGDLSWSGRPTTTKKRLGSQILVASG